MSPDYLCIGIVKSLVVRLPEVDNIDVSLVHRLDVALMGIGPNRDGTVNAGYGNTVTGLNAVNLY